MSHNELSNSHSLVEDLVALLCGATLISLAITMYASVGLLTGGTSGAAILIGYITGWKFGIVFFLLNLPFIGLGLARMGRSFVIRTFVAVGLVSIFSYLTPMWISFSHLDPLFGACLGGALIGVGMLIIFRHRASLGGINILILYLQEHHNIRAGKVQMGIDCSIVLLASVQVSIDRLALSILGAVVTSAILVFNHKQGRYMGVS